ncbi:8043_t:CDS:10 [Ambispora leptoticha]|uniref:Pre-rRNA-processing protein n=1 Tax=Ambispora leptoticha TaxID=144679 RepID=A0A9N8YNS4_9GLOM|nr:8043_t:CDS:10 [Ambispora leptoticha]
MPKKSQHKKKLKQEDFKKTKLKVGKKKLPATNLTNVSFKSQTIILPNQSITEDKSSELTNSRRLTLNDLLIQLRHYNPGSRRDAIQGLADYFHRYPFMLPRSLSNVINATVRLLVDEDISVRKSLFSFFQEFLPALNKMDLIPFLPLLIIYTCSGMTHIYEDIRIDALKFMNIWLSIAPEVVVNGFWDKILPNYISFLTSNPNVTEFSNSSFSAIIIPLTNSSSLVNSRNGMLSQEVKIDALKSFQVFLEAGMLNDVSSHWYFMSLLSTGSLNQQKNESEIIVNWDERHGQVFYSPPHPLIGSLLPNIFTSSGSDVSKQLNLFDASESTSTIDKKSDRINLNSTTMKFQFDSGPGDSDNNTKNISAIGRLSGSKSLLDSIHPLLISMWLDAAPSVFASSNLNIRDTSALHILHLILNIMKILWRTILLTPAKETKEFITPYWNQLFKYLVVYFPFGWETNMHDNKVESILLEMNIIFSEMASSYIFIISENKFINQKGLPSHHHKSDNKGIQDSETKLTVSHLNTIDQIVKYVLRILGYSGNNNDTRMMSSATINVKPELLSSLLPTITCLLNCIDQDQQLIVFQAFIDYSKRCHSQSTAKRICIEFVADVFELQIHPLYTGNFKIQSNKALSSLIQTWLLSLPKILWELKLNNLETSKKILQIMCDIIKRGLIGSFDAKMYDQIQMALVPFLVVHLSNKGPIYGPFINLPTLSQRKFLEFLFYCPHLNDKLTVALSEVLLNEQIEIQIKNYAAMTVTYILEDEDRAGS